MSTFKKARNGVEPPSLPKTYATIEQILYGEVSVGKMTNLCGVVKDCRAPIPTNGKDHKMTVSICDLSSQEDVGDIDVTIFRPESEMPCFNSGDVLLALNLKVQRYRDVVSLICHRSTIFHIYSGILIPKPTENRSADMALKSSSHGRPPTDAENQYVSYMYHKLDKYHIPDQEAFQEAMTQSKNVKDKFSTLSNVTDGQFYTLVVQLVKDPYDVQGTLTCWVSDYTINKRFYHHGTNGAGGGRAGQDGDPYGYTEKFRNEKFESTSLSWPGPSGQMSMQISCWEPHAEYIRDNKLCMGTWVRLRNVQVKTGRNANNIEGFLRGDQTHRDRINVEVLDVDADSVSQLKEALRRERDYQKPHKRKAPHDQVSRISQKEAQQGADCQNKPQQQEKAPAETSKLRRKKLRAEKAEAAEAQQKIMEEEALGLNPMIKCENNRQEVSKVRLLLEPVYYTENLNGREIKIPIPFTNLNYRTNVRVVDFRPEKLEDFAVLRERSRYNDAISDDSDSCDSGTQDSLQCEDWEWCFSLLVEDAMADKSPGKRSADRVWVTVDNLQAQCLSLDDAVDLRRHSSNLNALREKMFTLWGNLEEIKRSRAEAQYGSRRGKQLLLPPPCSEDNASAGVDQMRSDLINKPFSCCIKQYGVRTKTKNTREADAGPGKKWVRVFGLFGTKICD